MQKPHDNSKVCRAAFVQDSTLVVVIEMALGHVHRPSSVPPTAAISLHRRELALGARSGLVHSSKKVVIIVEGATS
jgi:hypothetical protein